uniref:AI-2E family transporter n=1 Tax=Agathobacter sp. TaxID=2021311 RepID=UPI003FEDD944
MNDTEKEKVTQTQEKEKMDGRRENIHLAKIGVMVFITFVCCILFFFSVLRYQGFANGWHKVISAAQPIIIGLVLAYLLNPVMKFFERHLYRLFKDRMKTDQKARKMARGIAITCSIIFLIVVIVLLIAAIVPSVINSIMRIVDTLPANVANLVKMMQEGHLGNYEVADTIGDVLTKLTDYVENWATKTLLPQARTYLIQITSGVINMVKAMFNFVIGIIVAVYVLMIKERLIGQSKKVVYAVFKPKQGNIIVETMHKANDIFGGFIIGKIIDSAIIGVICYVGCSILRIPDTMLVSAIIGVTNIIPLFGPFIGAVPALLLVVIQSPWHALYLLIFIIVLQQVDGNIIGPKILGNSTGLTSFWVMFAILIGGGMFGFLGMLLGVPVFALMYYIVRRLVNHGVAKKQLPVMTADYVKVARIDENTREFQLYKETKKKKQNTAKKEDADNKNVEK